MRNIWFLVVFSRNLYYFHMCWIIFYFFLWNIKNMWMEILNLQENILLSEMEISKLINYSTNMWFLVVLFRHELYYFLEVLKKFQFKKKNKTKICEGEYWIFKKIFYLLKWKFENKLIIWQRNMWFLSIVILFLLSNDFFKILLYFWWVSITRTEKEK